MNLHPMNLQIIKQVFMRLSEPHKLELHGRKLRLNFKVIYSRIVTGCWTSISDADYDINIYSTTYPE